MQDDGNEDDCDEDYSRGLSVEALAHAAAALRRQSSSGSTESNSDLKLNFKQVIIWHFSASFRLLVRSFLVDKFSSLITLCKFTSRLDCYG